MRFASSICESAGTSLPQTGRAPSAVCIDDDLDFLYVLMQHVSDLGVSVVGASNAILGVRAIHRERPDVVILDHHMPNAFGTFVLRCLQQDYTLSSVSVIVVTGCDVQRLVEPGCTLLQQLTRLGARAVLQKPLKLHSLNATIQACLAGSVLWHRDSVSSERFSS